MSAGTIQTRCGSRAVGALAVALLALPFARAKGQARAADSVAAAPAADTTSAAGVSWHVMTLVTYEYNGNRPASGHNTLRVFDVDHNRVRFGVTTVTLAKAAAPVGFQLDLVSGQDVPLFASQGAWRPDAVDFEQAYVTWRPRAGRVTLVAGKFVTSAGSEVIPTWNNVNANLTRSFLFGYAIPFAHSGVRMNVSLGTAGVTLGVNRGWDKWEDNNGALSYELAATMAPRSWLSLALATHHGPEQASDRRHWRHLYDVVVTATPLPGWTLGLNADYAREAVAAPTGGTAVWYGAAGYASYAMSPRWTAAVRVERFTDRDGVRTGVQQTLRSADLTVDWAVRAHVLVRAGVRTDGSTAPVFEAVTYRRTQRTVALALVVKR